MAVSHPVGSDDVDPQRTKERSILEGWISSSATRADAELRAVHRKVDIKALAWYWFVYLIMRVDVSNISNMAIINIEQGNDIKKERGNLTSQQWAWVLSIF
jgi:hypothetical protein